MTALFSPAEIEKLGFYVYIYTDPRNDKPFYVGKGRGNRAFAHLKDGAESQKVRRIEEIRAERLEPHIEILASGLDERTAFKVEAAAIDLIGFENLTNAQIGHHARQFGRKSIDVVHAELSATPVERFDHDLVLIKINHSYDDTSKQSAMALYDATRGIWRVSLDSARRAEFAAAVFGGVIREVYRIAEWLPAESTQYLDEHRDVSVWTGTRYEFVGRVADASVRKRYRWGSVSHLYKKGAANPILYVGPGFGVTNRPVDAP